MYVPQKIEILYRPNPGAKCTKWGGGGGVGLGRILGVKFKLVCHQYRR